MTATKPEPEPDEERLAPVTELRPARPAPLSREDAIRAINQEDDPWEAELASRREQARRLDRRFVL